MSNLKTMYAAPKHCCPYCLKPVGYIGRGLSWLLGANLHNCDFLNVDVEAQRLRNRIGDAEADNARLVHEKMDMWERADSAERALKAYEDQKAVFAEEVRVSALTEAAQFAIYAGNHLSILPPAARKFPGAGKFIAARIIDRILVDAPVDNSGDIGDE